MSVKTAWNHTYNLSLYSGPTEVQRGCLYTDGYRNIGIHVYSAFNNTVYQNLECFSPTGWFNTSTEWPSVS